jgi:hypothetical protein
MEAKPWPWWVAVPVFVLIIAVSWGIWAVPLVWAPLAVIPIAIVGIALWRSFKGNLRAK